MGQLIKISKKSRTKIRCFIFYKRNISGKKEITDRAFEKIGRQLLLDLRFSIRFGCGEFAVYVRHMLYLTAQTWVFTFFPTHMLSLWDKY